MREEEYQRQIEAEKKRREQMMRHEEVKKPE